MKTFLQVWNQQREDLARQRGWTRDARQRKVAMLYGFDVQQLLAYWTGILRRYHVTIENSQWNKWVSNRDTILPHVIFSEYKDLWTVTESIARQLDGQGYVPPKESSGDLLSIAILFGVGLLLLGIAQAKGRK